MSEENVEIVRKVQDAFHSYVRGDLSEEALAEFVDPQGDVIWHDDRTLPDMGQHLRGVSQLQEFGVQLRSAFADLTFESLETIEAADDRILTLTRHFARGRESGVPLVFHVFHVWTIREGRVSKAELFRHRAEALEAAGLRE